MRRGIKLFGGIILNQILETIEKETLYAEHKIKYLKDGLIYFETILDQISDPEEKADEIRQYISAIQCAGMNLQSAKGALDELVNAYYIEDVTNEM